MCVCVHIYKHAYIASVCEYSHTFTHTCTHMVRIATHSVYVGTCN